MSVMPPYPPYPSPPPQSPRVRGVHQAATPAMVVGIVALAAIPVAGLSLILAPFAWALGRTARREIEASGGTLLGLDRARAGIVLGMIGTGLLVVVLVALAALLVLVAAGLRLEA